MSFSENWEFRHRDTIWGLGGGQSWGHDGAHAGKDKTSAGEGTTGCGAGLSGHPFDVGRSSHGGQFDGRRHDEPASGA